MVTEASAPAGPALPHTARWGRPLSRLRRGVNPQVSSLTLSPSQAGLPGALTFPPSLHPAHAAATVTQEGLGPSCLGLSLSWHKPGDQPGSAALRHTLAESVADLGRETQSRRGGQTPTPDPSPGTTMQRCDSPLGLVRPALSAGLAPGAAWQAPGTGREEQEEQRPDGQERWFQSPRT